MQQLPFNSFHLDGPAVCFDPLLHLLHRGTFLLINCQHVLDQHLYPVLHLHIRREVQHFLHALKQHQDVLSAMPWVQIVQHFVEDYSQTPHVTLYGVGVAKQYLRRHVYWSAYVDKCVPTLVCEVGFYFISSSTILANPKSEIFKMPTW